MYGSAEAQARASALVAEILDQPRNARKVAGDAARMRLEIARHKPPASTLDVKLGPGGLVDLEFAVHVLQLTHRTGFDPRLETAVAELAKRSLLSESIAEAQQLFTRMLVMMRLVAPGDVKPTAATWQLVASACGAESWDELLARHDAARQSVAELWTKVKGDQE